MKHFLIIEKLNLPTLFSLILQVANILKIPYEMLLGWTANTLFLGSFPAPESFKQLNTRVEGKTDLNRHNRSFSLG